MDMASSAEYAAFVCEQIAPYGQVRSRKMFGEYMVYLEDKPVLLVCDNTVYVKKLPQVSDLLLTAPCGFPYEEAKEHYRQHRTKHARRALCDVAYILDIENRELLDQLMPTLKASVSLQKKKK